MNLEAILKNSIRIGITFVATSYLFLITSLVLINHYTSFEFWVWSIPFLLVQLLEIIFFTKSLVLKPKELCISSSSVIICLLCFFAFLISSMVINTSVPTSNIYLKFISSGVNFLIYPFIIYSLLTLKDRLTVLPEAHSLVNTGPYKYFRHPLYLSYIIFLVSSMLMFNSLMIYAANFVLICLFIMRAKLEENVLEANITGYKEYKKLTPFIPGVKWL